ncbi:MAG: TonB-dependent receptor [Calditrichaceae bacterium]
MLPRLVLYLFMCLLVSLYADDPDIAGSVYDLETLYPLSNVNIEILNTPFGGVSDSNGSFNINLDPGYYKLRFSMMGYQTQDIEIDLEKGKTERLNVMLIPTIYLMQGVMVIQERDGEDSQGAVISNTSVQSKNVVKMPGSFTDIYRSVKTLPGVTSNNGMSSEFNVRGGTFDENLVIVNDAQVYSPFHLKEAPNASIAIFNMDLLSKVDLVTGGFTARYGDKMSSVMNVQYRQGNMDSFKFQADASSMHVGLMAEGPLYKGSWILGYRKSYLQYLLGLLGTEDGVNIDYYNVQGQIVFEPIPAKKFTFQFIHSKDDYKFDPTNWLIKSSYDRQWFTATSQSNDFETSKADYYNTLYSLSFVNGLNSKLFTKTVLSHYIEYENGSLTEKDNWTQTIWDKYYHRYYYFYSDENYQENLDLKIMTSELNQQVTFRLNPFHEFLAGVSYKHLNYDYFREIEEFNQWGDSYKTYPDTSFGAFNNHILDDINPNSYKANVFIEDNWQISDNVFANLGMRLDYFDFNRDYNVSPRINLSYKTGSGIIYRLAWGYYYQSPSYRELKYTFATSENTKAQRSIHYILGSEWSVNRNWKLKLEGYLKNMDNLISFENRNGNIVYSKSNDSRGYASGVDLFINWNYERYSGWISYGFLKAKEDSIGDNYGYIPRATDQTHTFSFVGNAALGKSWDVRLKFLYGSGFPYTPSTFEIVDEDKNIWGQVIGRRNSARLPSYQRVDIRAGRQFSLGRFSSEIYLELINLFGRKNVYSYEWNWHDGNWRKEAVELLPLIPNFGLVIRY